MSTLIIDARYCGPPGCANGGYFSGLMASHSKSGARVRLERPIPLQQPLELTSLEDGSLECLHQGQVIARTQPQNLSLSVPEPPDYLQALEASRHFVGFAGHTFPRCFVCGTARARGDGLRIFAGAVQGRELVAATWAPDPSLSDGEGKVRPEFMSAALDCPGYFAARSDGAVMLLGEFTAHVDRCVHIDEPCILVGWRIGVSGRKYQVGTALFDQDGNLCARAQALWIEPRSAA